MPVKSENIFKLDINDDEWISDYTSEFVMSDDIWNKFELPNGDMSDIVFSDLDIEPATLSSLFELSEIRNHDCMWAGHCGSKEHPADEFKPVSHIVVPGSMQQIVTNAPAKPAVSTGRSLLLKTQFQQNVSQTPAVNVTAINANPVLTNLESPPNSDDEEPKIKTEVLQILEEAISEYDLEEDSDLCEYFEEDVEDELLSESVEEKHKPTPVQQPNADSTTLTSSTAHINVAQFTSDHCYHKDKNASMRMNNLGIETPSDSEEEIDVVSVGEKQILPTRMVCTLPNNPSRRDKQHIQRTMASAISKNGIKTLLPRKPSIEQSSPVKRRVLEHRGMKRSKHRSSPSTSPYKKRSSYNHSSDSEPEPSEKRNLHNNMERQRRIDLRNAFEDLRCLVPEVSKRERAPKVVILREAALYCDSLGNHSDYMHRQVDDLRRQQRRLRARVSQLRLSLAAKHR